MPDFLKLITLSACVAMGSSAFAQDTATPTTPAAETAAPADQATNDPLPLDMGEEVVDERGPGTTYIKEHFNEWEMRCVRVEEGQKEPCSLFQLLKNEQGDPIIEFNMVTLPEGGQAVAGATVVAPLETLLPKRLTIAVDSGAKKRYEFRFCNPIGCYTQVGFSNGDVASFKRGASATLSIFAVFTPEDPINVTLSLAGFTKAYEALKEYNAD